MRRIQEIDLLRTIAIMLMIVYHTAYDLRFFYDWHINLYGPAWETLRITTVSLFLFVAGVSSQLSQKPLRRALIVLGYALLITITTYIYDSSTFIYFGILHCIGVGMLVLILLKRLKEIKILLGTAIILFPLSSFRFPLFDRPTLDFYAPIPWLGIMLIGAGIGHFLYIRNDFSALQHFNISSLLTQLGQHALLIYLLHQPIILAILALLYAW